MCVRLCVSKCESKCRHQSQSKSISGTLDTGSNESSKSKFSEREKQQALQYRSTPKNKEESQSSVRRFVSLIEKTVQDNTRKQSINDTTNDKPQSVSKITANQNTFRDEVPPTSDSRSLVNEDHILEESVRMTDSDGSISKSDGSASTITDPKHSAL